MEVLEKGRLPLSPSVSRVGKKEGPLPHPHYFSIQGRNFPTLLLGRLSSHRPSYYEEFSNTSPFFLTGGVEWPLCDSVRPPWKVFSMVCGVKKKAVVFPPTGPCHLFFTHTIFFFRTERSRRDQKNEITRFLKKVFFPFFLAKA